MLKKVLRLFGLGRKPKTEENKPRRSRETRVVKLTYVELDSAKYYERRENA
jgi:hypothetical protein